MFSLSESVMCGRGSTRTARKIASDAVLLTNPCALPTPNDLCGQVRADKGVPMQGGPAEQARQHPGPGLHAVSDTEPEDLMGKVAQGDEAAFAALYDQIADRIFGLVLRVMRDPAQSEEVTQEIFVEIWRTASRYQRDRGSVMAWAMTLAHRRAVDRVRSVQASTDRENRIAIRDRERPFDVVSEEVVGRLERQAVTRCLETLTTLQHESVSLAYYQGYTYGEVARLLDTPLGTIKTRLRDGLIRLRDCLGVAR